MAEVCARSQRPAILINGGQRAVRRDLQDRAGSLRRRRSRGGAFLGVNRFHGRAHGQRLQGGGELSAAARMVQRGVAAALNFCRGAAAAFPAAGGRWSGKRRRCQRHRREASASVAGCSSGAQHGFAVRKFQKTRKAAALVLLCSDCLDHDPCQVTSSFFTVGPSSLVRQYEQ